jgi:hypothetical protein
MSYFGQHRGKTRERVLGTEWIQNWVLNAIEPARSASKVSPTHLEGSWGFSGYRKNTFFSPLPALRHHIFPFSGPRLPPMTGFFF